MSTSRTIYLTGFMGSGKSTVGPALAAALGQSYVDLDAVIAARADKAIPEVFAEEGEARFRELEREALLTTGRSGAEVVALGGGALADAENLAYALQAGVIVYLWASARVLAARLAAAAAERPMLQDDQGRPLRGDALVRRVESLLVARSAYYERAHLTVSTERRSVDSVVGEIVDGLGRL